MTKEALTPEAIVQLVKCGCERNRYHLRKSGLNCTYLCSCCNSDNPCENAFEDTDTLKIEYED